MSLANLVFESGLLQRSAVPMRLTQKALHVTVERDHYTHKLQRGGTACVVCLDDFHENCVRRWLQHHTRCPYRCSDNIVLKRNQSEARENFADEEADSGESDMQ